MKNLSLLILSMVFIISCKKTDLKNENELGGGVIFDASLAHPQNYLLSLSNPTPSVADALKPVLVVCHGYSASTFEWQEFKSWSQGRTDYNISQVLLAGHGVTYDEFKKSSWHDWQQSILKEYNALVKEGYKNINFAGSSTSCALLLDLVHQGIFDNSISKVNIFLIDPIVIPSDKNLSLIGIIGPALGYVTSNLENGEEKYYYHLRPQETLKELQSVINVVRKELEGGITLPKNVTLKVYKSIQDPTADPVSAVLIYKGVKTSGGGNINLQFIDSKIHVFTRLSLVPNVTAKDKQNQTDTFTDITKLIF